MDFPRVPTLIALVLLTLLPAALAAQRTGGRTSACLPPSPLLGEWKGRFMDDDDAALTVWTTGDGGQRATLVYETGNDGSVVEEELTVRIRQDGVRMAGRGFRYLQRGRRAGVFQLDTLHLTLAGSRLEGRAWDGSSNGRVAMQKVPYSGAADRTDCDLTTAARLLGSWQGRVYSDENARLTFRRQGNELVGTLVITTNGATVQEDLSAEFLADGQVILRGTAYRVLRGSVVAWALDTLTLQAQVADGEPVLRGTVTDFTNESGEVRLSRTIP